MNHLYHRVPPQMKGEVLYPLNELKGVDLSLYEEEVKKYKGREFVTEQKIPRLDCLWNDVLHFSAVHPQKIEDELKKWGERQRVRKFFQIDPQMLEPEKAVVYLFSHKDKEDKFESWNWTHYDPNIVSKYSEISDRTKKYYHKMIREREKPLLWAFVPHIMYKGRVNTADMKVIELE